ncbi:hypothetical protein JCM3775_005730 [Rhodotorula graminis]
MSAHECAVCSNQTVKKCAACESVFFCSPACQKAVWSTHKWACGKGFDTFSQAPLSHDEVELLHKLDKMESGRTNSPCNWHFFLKRDKLSRRGVNDLLRELQDPECRIPEPSRTLILSDLRGNMFRAACDEGLVDKFEVTPWVLVGRMYRELWRNNGVKFGSNKGMAQLVGPTLNQYLLLETLRDRRSSAKGMPEGVPDDVEALALQRTSSSLEELVKNVVEVSRGVQGRELDGQGRDAVTDAVLRILDKCEKTRTTQPGRRMYCLNGLSEIVSIVRMS